VTLKEINLSQHTLRPTIHLGRLEGYYWVSFGRAGRLAVGYYSPSFNYWSIGPGNFRDSELVVCSERIEEPVR
jgi:hypothetical protein